jgi:hypothetical protein
MGFGGELEVELEIAGREERAVSGEDVRLPIEPR